MLKSSPELTGPAPAKIEITDSSSPSGLARLVKEPLLHFVLAGAAIYLLFGLFGESESDVAVVEENRIVITEGEIDSFTQIWQQQWKRPPTPQELKGLLDQHVRETVLYREALAMGLDKDDTIVRRRLAQKLEFLCQDLAQPQPPSDDQLRNWFQENVDRYQAPDLVTFTHVFLDPDKREQQTLDDAEKLKAQLSASPKAPSESTDLGDPFMLQRYYPERSEFDLSKLFGSEFARSVMTLDPGEWHGPVLSGYGVHLVYIHDLQESPPPTYPQIADRVRQDWEDAKRKELNDQYVAGLLDRYEVVIESDDSTSPSSTTSSDTGGSQPVLTGVSR